MLPQINLAFLLPDEQAVRVGLAKELARPRMDQLKATEESGYNFGTGEPGGSGGNPRSIHGAPTPSTCRTRSTCRPGGYVSVAGFYKDLGATSTPRPIRTTIFRICST